MKIWNTLTCTQHYSRKKYGLCSFFAKLSWLSKSTYRAGNPHLFSLRCRLTNLMNEKPQFKVPFILLIMVDFENDSLVQNVNKFYPWSDEDNYPGNLCDV